jgi:hypothetical protein
LPRPLGVFAALRLCVEFRLLKPGFAFWSEFWQTLKQDHSLNHETQEWHDEKAENVLLGFPVFRVFRGSCNRMVSTKNK